MLCTICVEVYSGEIRPIALPCAHVICRLCYSLLRRPNCPTCNYPINFGAGKEDAIEICNTTSEEENQDNQDKENQNQEDQENHDEEEEEDEENRNKFHDTIRDTHDTIIDTVAENNGDTNNAGHEGTENNPIVIN